MYVIETNLRIFHQKLYQISGNLYASYVFNNDTSVNIKYKVDVYLLQLSDTFGIIIKSKRIISYHFSLVVSNQIRIFANQIVSKWRIRYIILN